MENTEIVPEIKTGYYRHFKGSIAFVLGITYNSEDVKPYVVYIHFGTDSLGRVNAMWSRPYSAFIDEKEVDGKLVKRFEYIGEVMPK